MGAAVTGLTNTATSVTAMASKVSLGELSSGLSAIPGAEKAISTVTNNATGAINAIPGTGAISSAISSLTSTVNTGISNATGSASALLGALGGASLQSLAGSGLPASALAQMQAAIGSLSSGGSSPIKLPSVGFNTTNRDSIGAAITAVLGDAKIPAPMYAGNPAVVPSVAQSMTQSLDDKLKEMIALREAQEKQGVELAKARKAFIAVRDSLPEGDPAIEQAKATYLAEFKTFSEISDKMHALANSA